MDGRKRALAALSNIICFMIYLALSTASRGGSVKSDAEDYLLEKEIWTSSDDELPKLEKRTIKILQEDPKSPFAHYLLAHINVRMYARSPSEVFLLKQAGDLAQQAVDLSPDRDFGYIAMAEIVDLVDSSEKALLLLQNAMSTQMEPSWRSYFMLAKLNTESQDSKSVLAMMEQSIHFTGSQPDIVAPYIVAVLNSTYQGNELESELTKWNHKVPNRVFSSARARNAEETGKYKLAESIYEDLLRQEKGDWEAGVSLAVLLIQHSNRPERAISIIESIEKSDHYKNIPEQSKTWLYLYKGHAELQIKHESLAEKNFFRAFSREKNKSYIYDYVTQSYTKSGNFKSYAHLLEQVGNELSGSGFLYATLAQIQSEKLKLYPKAIDSFSKAILLEPERSDYHNGLGLIYYKINQIDVAKTHFKNATKVDPEDASAHYNYACALALTGENQNAISALREAIALDPTLANSAKTDADLRSLNDSSEFLAITGSNSIPSLSH